MLYMVEATVALMCVSMAAALSTMPPQPQTPRMPILSGSKMLGLPASTLRYYESQGLLPELARTSGGRRQFTERDIVACRVIECLKASGLSIAEIREFMDMVVEGDSTLEERLALFERRREPVKREMEQLERTLAVLDFKRWYYKRAVDAGTEDVVRDLPKSKIPARHRKAKAMLSGK